MFQGLRQNSLFYILEKTNDGLIVKIGQVESVSNPQPKYNMSVTPTYGQQPEMFVDVRVKVGDEILDFKQLNANMNIANSGNVVVSDSRDAMNAEIDGVVNASKRHIEENPYHEKIVKTGDSAKRIINPQFAKEKEQEEKIDALEERMGNINDKLNQMFELLSDTLEQRKNKKTKEE